MKSDIRKVPVFCNNCGINDEEFVTSGHEHEYTSTTNDIFNVAKCRRCGLLYLNPRPDVSELKTIYPDDYYAYNLHKQSVEHEQKNSPLYKARKFVYLQRLKKALSLCPPAAQLSVLDIGCADGRALDWYRQVNDFKVSTYGVDFDETALERARQAGHQVYSGRFEDADIPEDKFDLAVATHVIEHVADPKAFASRAFAVLKPGGIFLCETPNVASWDARMFRDQHWGGYHFPRHWVFYSPQSITAMAKEVGFELLKIEFHPAPAFWNWTFHSLVGSLSKTPGDFAERTADCLFPPVDFQKNNLRNFFAVSLFTCFDIAQKLLTGQTSNMSVVLRKPLSVVAPPAARS
jgi:2-polyprenyl-3-methyl-5-hydroxy-6-metoxy-1,4-benzoquinol methylase